VRYGLYRQRRAATPAPRRRSRSAPSSPPGIRDASVRLRSEYGPSVYENVDEHPVRAAPVGLGPVSAMSRGSPLERRIAFIQCVGPATPPCSNSWCSSVRMYATKRRSRKETPREPSARSSWISG
jgi:heterodisulfide reductase subunit A-like polyferredoxin